MIRDIDAIFVVHDYEKRHLGEIMKNGGGDFQKDKN
jgi:hypothetical protein